MCCASRSGTGRSRGSAPSTCARAGGPPVDAAIPTTSTCAPCASCGRAGVGLERCRRTTGTSAISRTDSATRCAQRRIFSGPPSGFAISSSAPAAIALNDSSSCRCCRTDVITRTREGASAMMAAVAPSPSSRGMLTSMVITSGRSARAFSTASTPSAAWPTMAREGSSLSRATSAVRRVVESSATSTRMGRALTQPPSGARSPRSPRQEGARRRTPSW